MTDALFPSGDGQTELSDDDKQGLVIVASETPSLDTVSRTVWRIEVNWVSLLTVLPLSCRICRPNRYRHGGQI